MSPIKALNALSLKPLNQDHHTAWIAEATQEISDRGAAILRATEVENHLSAAIEIRLGITTQQDRERLFGSQGPISTFGNKILMGRMLEIYGTKTESTLTYVRHIRNAFAHARLPIKFSTPEVAAVCELVQVPQIAEPNGILANTLNGGPADGTPREKFDYVCLILTHNLLIYQHQALQTFPLPKDDPEWVNYQQIIRPKPLP